MSDDWQVGDLALCVDAGPPKTLGGYREGTVEAILNLREGIIYHVDRIVRGNFDQSFVGLTDLTRRAGGVSTRFRKIRADEHTGERSDWELLLEQHKQPSKVATQAIEDRELRASSRKLRVA